MNNPYEGLTKEQELQARAMQNMIRKNSVLENELAFVQAEKEMLREENEQLRKELEGDSDGKSAAGDK